MPRVSVILPAAGSGSRFGADENKIFADLAGRAVFEVTLAAFARRPDVAQTLLVVSAGDEPRIRADYAQVLAETGTQVVRGGTVRGESVRNALAHVTDTADVVAVHDAVRPCVTDAWLDVVFTAAAQTGAALLACPIHGTIKRVGPDGTITQTVPREGLWEAQTPQAFGREILQAAYARADLANATDDCMLVEAMGHPVTVVPADRRNVKITTPADLAFAAAALKTLDGAAPS